MDTNNDYGLMIMRFVNTLAKGIWQLVSFLFWPQRTDKTRYGQRKLEETDSRLD